jgi:hypothetical protein
LASIRLGPQAKPTFAGVSVQTVAAGSAIVVSYAGTSAAISSLTCTSATITSLANVSAKIVYAYISTLAANTIYVAEGIEIKAGKPLYFDGA